MLANIGNLFLWKQNKKEINNKQVIIELKEFANYMAAKQIIFMASNAIFGNSLLLYHSYYFLLVFWYLGIV